MMASIYGKGDEESEREGHNNRRQPYKPLPAANYNSIQIRDNQNSKSTDAAIDNELWNWERERDEKKIRMSSSRYNSGVESKWSSIIFCGRFQSIQSNQVNPMTVYSTATNFNLQCAFTSISFVFVHCCTPAVCFTLSLKRPSKFVSTERKTRKRTENAF